MKFIYSCVIMVISASLALAQPLDQIISEHSVFSVNEEVFLFGHNVKLRSAPNTNADIIATQRIGTELTILEKTNFQTQYNGINSYWYKVASFYNEGYILGALIAKKKLDSFGHLLVQLSIDSEDLY